MNKSTGISTEFREKLGMKLIYVLLSTFIFLFLLIIVVAFFASLHAGTGFAENLKEISGATGPIGDTLGGTMGPLIAIIASILTFWAFMEQYKANEIQIRSQNKNEFESRAFQLLSLSNEKRKLLSEIENDCDIFEIFFQHFNINLNIYCGSHIGNDYSTNTAYYFRRRFKRGLYGEHKKSFDSMIFYTVIPIMHGLRSSKFPLFQKHGYVNALTQTYTYSNIPERKYVLQPLDDYNFKGPLLAKVLKKEHLRYGLYNDMSSHINSIKLILEFIFGAKKENIITEKDADFFYKLVLNEMSTYEQLFFFIFFITYKETDLFLTEELVKDSKLFENVNFDILRDILTDNFLRFKNIEDYFNNNFDLLPSY